MQKLCERCQKPIPPSLGKKPRRFCSQRCISRASYNRSPEPQRARCRKWRKENPEKFKQSKKNWIITHPEAHSRSVKNTQLKREYGITLDIYEAACTATNNCCWICGRDPGKWKLRVDHCHQQNKRRGLLCDNCNIILGHAHDDPIVLAKAIQYLRAGVNNAPETST